MTTEYDAGAQRKKRMITTYGKAAKKRQPKAVFTPATASDSMSEDEDPVAASDTIQTVSSSDRKRKISQIYKPRQQSQGATDESDEEDLPPAPEPRRSRITQPENRPTTKPSNRERGHAQQRSPSDTMGTVAAKTRPSSPPPTPTPRVPKSTTKVLSSYGAKKKSTNVLPERGTQKQPVQQQHQIPLHLGRGPSLKAKPLNTPPTTTLLEKNRSPTMKNSSGPSFAKKPRKRLIDVLVEQESDDVTVLEDHVTDTQVTSSQYTLGQSSNVSELDNSDIPETPKTKSRTAPVAGARNFTRSSSALKFTYGQGRKVLEESDDLLESLALPAESSYSKRRLDIGGGKKPTPATGAFDFNDDDGTTTASPSSKLRGIHELRQAGANSRVADEMQDLVDQIGEPGAGSLSSRRAALLQVAEKMRDKSFIRQCHDHDVESTLLKNIGKETDVISSYLILSSLVAIIAGRTSGRLLRVGGAGPVFAQLLSISDDIKKVAKDRKSNLSKRSQNSILTIESLLRELPVWDGDQPSYISPRCLAIKCLQLLITQDILIGRDATVFTTTVTKQLFDVLSDAANDFEYWDYPKTAQSIELRGALSVLDAFAASVAATQGGSEWATPYLGTIANAFYKSTQTSSQHEKTLEVLLLKLTINVANNNHAAADAFASKGTLLAALATSISASFDQALALILQGAWDERILDTLVLRLGILINFAEHSGQVRQMVDKSQYDNREPVKELIRLFNENHRRMGEADSMEKTQLNVAFGYLSVLLGYLALHQPVRQKIVSSHSARSIGPLIESIREFIAYYEQVETAISESEEGEHSRGGYAERLQELVQQLEDKAARE